MRCIGAVATTVVVRRRDGAHAGSPDLYVWMPGSAGPPGWWSNAFAGDEQVTFVAPEAGVYLIEVRGYSDAVYALDLTPEGGLGMVLPSLSQEKPLSPAPLVADAPDTTAAAPLPGFSFTCLWSCFGRRKLEIERCPSWEGLEALFPKRNRIWTRL